MQNIYINKGDCTRLKNMMTWMYEEENKSLGLLKHEVDREMIKNRYFFFFFNNGGISSSKTTRISWLNSYVSAL